MHINGFSDNAFKKNLMKISLVSMEACNQEI